MGSADHLISTHVLQNPIQSMNLTLNLKGNIDEVKMVGTGKRFRLSLFV